MRRFRIFMTVCVLGAALCLGTGCGSQDGSNNNSVTEGTDQKDKKNDEKDGVVGDGVEDLGDGAGDAIKDVGDGVGDAVEDVGDGVKDATDSTDNETNTQDTPKN